MLSVCALSRYDSLSRVTFYPPQATVNSWKRTIVVMYMMLRCNWHVENELKRLATMSLL